MASLLVPASLANRLSESERARIDHEAPPIIDGSPPLQNPNLLRQASTSAAFVRKASSRASEAGIMHGMADPRLPCSDVRFVQAHPSLREHVALTVNATAGDGGAGPGASVVGAPAAPVGVAGGGMPGRPGPPADVIDQKLEQFMQDNLQRLQQEQRQQQEPTCMSRYPHPKQLGGFILALVCTIVGWAVWAVARDRDLRGGALWAGIMGTVFSAMTGFGLLQRHGKCNGSGGGGGAGCTGGGGGCTGGGGGCGGGG